MWCRSIIKLYILHLLQLCCLPCTIIFCFLLFSDLLNWLLIITLTAKHCFVCIDSEDCLPSSDTFVSGDGIMRLIYSFGICRLPFFNNTIFLFLYYFMCLTIYLFYSFLPLLLLLSSRFCTFNFNPQSFSNNIVCFQYLVALLVSVQ